MATAMNDDVLKCAVCSEVYANPKTLPCMHSFCCKCLKDIAKDGNVNCPECEAVHVFSVDDIDGLNVCSVIPHLIRKRKYSEIDNVKDMFADMKKNCISILERLESHKETCKADYEIQKPLVLGKLDKMQIQIEERSDAFKVCWDSYFGSVDDCIKKVKGILTDSEYVDINDNTASRDKSYEVYSRNKKILEDLAIETLLDKKVEFKDHRGFMADILKRDDITLQGEVEDGQRHLHQRFHDWTTVTLPQVHNLSINKFCFGDNDKCDVYVADTENNAIHKFSPETDGTSSLQKRYSIDHKEPKDILCVGQRLFVSGVAKISIYKGLRCTNYTDYLDDISDPSKPKKVKMQNLILLSTCKENTCTAIVWQMNNDESNITFIMYEIEKQLWKAVKFIKFSETGIKPISFAGNYKTSEHVIGLSTNNVAFFNCDESDDSVLDLDEGYSLDIQDAVEKDVTLISVTNDRFDQLYSLLDMPPDMPPCVRIHSGCFNYFSDMVLHVNDSQLRDIKLDHLDRITVACKDKLLVYHE